MPRFTPPRPRLRHLRLAGDLLVLAVVLWIVLGPGGLVGARVSAWWDARRVDAAAREAWTEVVAEGGVLGSGAAGGPTLAVFSDYRCPYCRAAQAEVDAFLAARPGVRVVVRHLPVETLHPDAPRLARIAACAENDTAFPAVHRLLFGAPRGAPDGAVEGLLARAGVADPDAVLACADTDRAHDRVRADVALAERLGMRGTPTFVGPGGAHLGAADRSRLEALLGVER